MRILVTGKNGQLGKSIRKLVNAEAKKENNPSSNKFIFVGREELDLNNESNINHYFDSNDKFDIIINCAAYTQVDKAEQEAELANQINHLAVKQLASKVNRQQGRLIHISTDYVFDGESNKPYVETDIPNPINAYGRTKLAGEKALQEVMPMNAFIIRTSWLYSEFSNNFVKTIIKLGKERDELNIVADQIGSPTYATDLAAVILSIIKSEVFSSDSQSTEIYHYSNDGEISWYKFAEKAIELADIQCSVNPITTDAYPTLAQRPKNTVMQNDKIARIFGLKIVDWNTSLGLFFEKVCREY